MRRWGVIPLLVLCAGLHEGRAEHALPDYKYFRRLSIDLVGRPPSRDELGTFEKQRFSIDGWIDQHLTGPQFAERLRRVYMDLLRLEVGPQFQFVPASAQLRRVKIIGPNGPLFVYYRRGQRRVPIELDGDFCFTAFESGLKIIANQAPKGTPIEVSQALLDARTEVVKPWWLYADYRAAQPSDGVAKDWAKRFPGFRLVAALQFEPDGKTPATQIRVCREEAQQAETGRIYASGRASPAKKDPIPPYRASQPPGDSHVAKTFKNRSVSCLTATGFNNSVECGCGPGLERCLPSTTNNFESPSFVLPTATALGTNAPFATSGQPAASWLRLWWAQEAKQFFDDIFESDRDVRELLTSRATRVNGPLAFFYRFIANATCCGPAAELEYVSPESLVDPAAIPTALVPQDTATWLRVPDRGPYSAGIMTMPIFLAKYGSRRARAHVLYNAFLCKSFVAETVELTPSTEPDLTKREGCSTCHKTLEPLAAYFTRINEADWTFWPARVLPATMPACMTTRKGADYCKRLYDKELGSTLRGGYTALDHVEQGPPGLATAITQSPEFAPCVVQNVAQSFLGRPLTADDARWKDELTKVFVDGGYRMRALVRAIVTSSRYRAGSDTKP